MAGMFFGIGFGAALATLIASIATIFFFDIDLSIVAHVLVICCSIMIMGIGMKVFEK